LTIKCHEHALSCLEFNFSGSLVASASESGTLVRIWCTKTAKMIQEFRRGHEHVILFSLSFDFDDNWLACISDSGTVHIFAIDDKKLKEHNIKK
jgi:WD40 repeat protein